MTEQFKTLLYGEIRMKTTLGRPLQISLRNAAEHPKSWDVPGLLQDAASNLDEMQEAMEQITNLSTLAWTDPATIQATFLRIKELASKFCPSRCPDCGYTENDKRIHGDHHLCTGN